MEADCEETSLIIGNVDTDVDVDAASASTSISALSCQYKNTVSVICSNSEFIVEDSSVTFQPAEKILTKYRKIQPQPSINKTNASTIVMLDSASSHSIQELSNTSSNSNSILRVEQLQIAGYYCNICNYFYQGSTNCPAHTEPSLVILDSAIPTQARLTLPKQLYLQKSNVVTEATGVCAQLTVEKKSQFGPLVGKTVNKEEIDGIHISDKNNLWKVYNDSELTYGLEADDENQCNWMMFVQRARTSAEQNVVAFLLSSQIYFMTTKTILPDTELLYWYSTDFCSLLGIPIKPEDGFECSECLKKFLTFNGLNRHMKYLHASIVGRKFQCSMCQKFFTSASKLSIHALGHMGIKPHTCDICHKQFSDASNLRGHLSIHTGVCAQLTVEKKSQFGPLVGKTVNKEEIDGIHISDKNNLWKVYNDSELTYGLEADDENQCNWMMFVQRARTSAEQNVVAFLLSSQIYFMTTKTILPDTELLYWYSTDFCSLLGIPIKPEDGFECSECLKKFLTFNGLNRHMKYLHASIVGRKFQCSMCQKFFTSASKLSIHALGHMGIKPHTCDICHKQFSDASNLRGHLSIHTGERRFKCNSCEKTFRQKAHLVSHMLTHTGEKKYKCHFCDRWFARTSDLRQHEITHNCEKLYPCPICKKTFYRLQTQKKHLKVHGGQRDFQCTQCEKRFFTKYHLERHCKSCRGKESG
uniref:Protein krueppel n=1 Tax=Strigamia maritima TaxID=126957 RepID=T1JH23_STRMM